MGQEIDFLSAVHTEMLDKTRRKSYIVVQGLAAAVGLTDVELFQRLCTEQLRIDPPLVKFPRRVGKKRKRSIQRLVLSLESEIEASRVLSNVHRFCESTSDVPVYINADLTKAESKAAFLERERRRQQTKKKHSNSNTGHLDLIEQMEQSRSVTVPPPVPAGQFFSWSILYRTVADQSHSSTGVATDVHQSPGVSAKQSTMNVTVLSAAAVPFDPNVRGHDLSISTRRHRFHFPILLPLMPDSRHPHPLRDRSTR